MSLDWFPKCFGNWFSLYRSQQYPGAKCHAVRNYFSALLFCCGSHSGSSDLLSHFPWILSPAGIIPSFARYFFELQKPAFLVFTTSISFFFRLRNASIGSTYGSAWWLWLRSDTIKSTVLSNWPLPDCIQLFISLKQSRIFSNTKHWFYLRDFPAIRIACELSVASTSGCCLLASIHHSADLSVASATQHRFVSLSFSGFPVSRRSIRVSSLFPGDFFDTGIPV